jgi:hypothetical protein
VTNDRDGSIADRKHPVLNHTSAATGHIRSFDERDDGVVERKTAAAHRNVPIATGRNAIVERNHTAEKRGTGIPSRNDPVAERNNAFGVCNVALADGAVADAKRDVALPGTQRFERGS